MSSEATITSSLTINKRDSTTGVQQILHTTQPASCTADVTGTKGPTPGSLTISTSGTVVSLTQITTPGLVRVMNQDTTNYIEFGVYNGATFFPFGEVLPGETFVFRFSRNLFYGSSGTASVNSLYARANTASCSLLVEAFDK